ncbi:MAG: pyridoxal 5'-phosphate synthase glutaminase subunit PdxT [Bdellovibrionales bacterium]|nr:pyridoxal 5'-phosphate synthase glutaminase subunit PdxT [Bdellovibrionales bacterium]
MISGDSQRKSHVVGILGLQGAISDHVAHFTRLGAETRIVRSLEELQSIDRLVLPGGESSTMLKLLQRGCLFEGVRDFATQKPVWGICAGAILLASEVVNPTQASLGSIQMRAVRNSYGCQLDSFSTEIEVPVLGAAIQVDFIRAPRLFSLQSRAEVLAHLGEDQVLIRQENILCSAFHTELGVDSRLHEYFLQMS